MAGLAKKPWQLPPQILGDVRLCIDVAQMRAKGMSYPAIAAEVGLDSAFDAQKCAERGFGLSADDEELRLARVRSACALNLIKTELWDVIHDPGPATTVSGKIIVNPETGELFPDRTVKTNALKTLLEAEKQDRVLHGADAPRRSVSLIGSLPEADLDAAIREREAELAERKKRAALQGKVIQLPAASDTGDDDQDDESAG